MIRWITDYIGTAPYLEAVSEKEDYEILDVRNLVDKQGNNNSEVDLKIKQGLECLYTGKKLLVCCDYGMSRSNSIAAGILSTYEKISIFDAIRTVIERTGEKEIKLPMINSVISWSGYNVNESRDAILVTGSKGFIGSKLMERLDDLNVTAPPSDELDLSKDRVELDLLLKENNIGTLVHLANPRKNTTYDALGQSLSMLKVVLDACLANNVRLVYVSSWIIYEGYKGDILADENTAMISKSNYGDLRVLSEKLIGMYLQRGLKLMMIRACSVYGIEKDVPKFIWNFIDKASKNETINTHEYINGNPKLDLINVNDLADVLEICVRSKDTGIFNIGGNKTQSTNEIAQLIIDHLRSDSRIVSTKIDDYVANVQMDTTAFSNRYHWEPKRYLGFEIDSMIKKYLGNPNG